MHFSFPAESELIQYVNKYWTIHACNVRKIPDCLNKYFYIKIVCFRRLTTQQGIMSFQHKFNNFRNYQNFAFAVLIEESFSEESHTIEK